VPSRGARGRSRDVAEPGSDVEERPVAASPPGAPREERRELPHHGTGPPEERVEASDVAQLTIHGERVGPRVVQQLGADHVSSRPV